MELDSKYPNKVDMISSSTSLAAQHSIVVRASWAELELNSLGHQENLFLVPRFSLVVSTGVVYPEFSISEFQGQCFFCSIPEAWMLWTRKLRVLEAHEGLWNVNKKKFWAVWKALEVLHHSSRWGRGLTCRNGKCAGPTKTNSRDRCLRPGGFGLAK